MTSHTLRPWHPDDTYSGQSWWRPDWRLEGYQSLDTTSPNWFEFANATAELTGGLATIATDSSGEISVRWTHASQHNPHSAFNIRLETEEEPSLVVHWSDYPGLRRLCLSGSAVHFPGYEFAAAFLSLSGAHQGAVVNPTEYWWHFDTAGFWDQRPAPLLGFDPRLARRFLVPQYLDDLWIGPGFERVAAVVAAAPTRSCRPDDGGGYWIDPATAASAISTFVPTADELANLVEVGPPYPGLIKPFDRPFPFRPSA